MGEFFDAGRTPADRMRRHAGDGDHLYAHLMRSMASDWEQGGPVRSIYEGWENAPTGWVIQLRLLAGLFRIVLTGRASQLERFYPCLGGEAHPSQAWPEVRQVMAAHVEELRESLTVAPQTNEVGRSNALLAGIFAAVAFTGRSQVRLLEPGASAGLNLLVDKFRFVNQGWDFGPVGSPVVLSGGILGDVQTAEFTIVDRRGCDVSPLDISTPAAILRLRSFVWPFHVERHERLAAALQIARQDPPRVDAAPAGEWLAQRLSEPVPDDVLTVVWQSITRQYWPPHEVERAASVIRRAAGRSAIAHVCMEYASVESSKQPVLTLEWSSGIAGAALRQVQLGTVGDHGFPVRIEGSLS